MSRPGTTHRPLPRHPSKATPRPRRPTTQSEQPRTTTNNPGNSNTNQLDPYFNQPQQPQPGPRIEIEPSIQETYKQQRQRYVPTPGRKVVWFAAIRWKASIEKVFQDGSTEINLDVMLIPHTNRVNAVMGTGMWRMGIFGAENSRGTGPRHDYQSQILSSFDQSNPLLPPNFLEFDVDTEFDIKSVGCGQYKYVCVEFDKAGTTSIEFDLVVEDGVLGPIVSCQAAPCACEYNNANTSFHAFLLSFKPFTPFCSCFLLSIHDLLYIALPTHFNTHAGT